MKRKLNILVTCPFPLLPANSGGRIYGINIIKPVISKYNYHLLVFVNHDERDEFNKQRDNLLKEYYKMFKSVTFIDRPLIVSEMKRMEIIKHFIHHAFTGLPLMDLSFFSRYSIIKVREIIKKNNIDIIEINHLHTAFFKRFIPNIPAILIYHNIESEIFPFWEKQTGGTIIKAIWNFFGKISRKNAYKVEIQNKFKFDAKFFISKRDFDLVHNENCEKFLLPMTFEPITYKKSFNKEKMSIIWVGGFDWYPNSEGIIWFVREIFPKFVGISDIVFHIIGKNPPEELIKLQNNSNLYVYGFVENIEPFLLQADLLIVPLLSGGGIRVKIIEAMNNGIPVLSTSKGCEGLNITQGENILVCDDRDAFINSIFMVKESLELREKLSSNGKKFFMENHSPENVVRVKHLAYEKIIKNSKSYLNS